MSPQCIEHQTTASHRPVNLFFWRALMILDAIRETASGSISGEESLPRPTEETVQAAMNLVSEVRPYRLLGDPSIDLFYGEIHLSWNEGARQVVLMFFPNRGPLIHHHRRSLCAPSEHGIDNGSAERLAYWLQWLHV